MYLHCSYLHTYLCTYAICVTVDIFVSFATIAQKPDASMPYKAGYEEDGFLQALGVTLDDLEPLADECSKVGTPRHRAVMVVAMGREDGLRERGNFAV